MNVILFNENMRADIRLNAREPLVQRYIYIYAHRMKKQDVLLKATTSKLVIELTTFLFLFTIFKSIIDSLSFFR